MKTYSLSELLKLMHGANIRFILLPCDIIYLDLLTTGEFSVTLNRKNLGVFDSLAEAESFIHELLHN